MRKTFLSVAGASLIAGLTLTPTIASADYRYHRDYDRGPNFSINIGPRYRHHWDDRYAYDYGRYYRHHHDHDWDRD
jgi:hypothetical protein